MVQNLAYALVQVIHNLGAVAVAGVPVCVLIHSCGDLAVSRRAAWVVLIAWAAQAVSGATFGAVSYYFYARPPDLHAIALAALFVKVACAVAGFSLAALCLIMGRRAAPFFAGTKLWRVLAGLGLTAITAAAVLRWFA